MRRLIVIRIATCVLNLRSVKFYQHKVVLSFKGELFSIFHIDSDGACFSIQVMLVDQIIWLSPLNDAIGITADIHAQEKIGIVGRTGAGLSTLDVHAMPLFL